MTTTEQSLPITEAIHRHLEWESNGKQDFEFLQQVRTMELSLIEKAKEDFRNSDEYKQLKERADKYDSLCK